MVTGTLQHIVSLTACRYTYTYIVHVPNYRQNCQYWAKYYQIWRQKASENNGSLALTSQFHEIRIQMRHEIIIFFIVDHS